MAVIEDIHMPSGRFMTGRPNSSCHWIIVVTLDIPKYAQMTVLPISTLSSLLAVKALICFLHSLRSHLFFFLPCVGHIFGQWSLKRALFDVPDAWNELHSRCPVV